MGGRPADARPVLSHSASLCHMSTFTRSRARPVPYPTPLIPIIPRCFCGAPQAASCPCGPHAPTRDRTSSTPYRQV